MDKNTFIGSLFDLTFDQFITTKMIKVLYIFAMIGSVIAGLSVFLSGFSEGGIGILAGLIGGVLTTFILLVFSRLGLELAIVIFRIADNSTVIANKRSAD